METVLSALHDFSAPRLGAPFPCIFLLGFQNFRRAVWGRLTCLVDPLLSTYYLAALVIGEQRQGLNLDRDTFGRFKSWYRVPPARAEPVEIEGTMLLARRLTFTAWSSSVFTKRLNLNGSMMFHLRLSMQGQNFAI